MLRKIFVSILIAGTLASVVSASTFCACCAEPGFRSISKQRVDASTLALLGEMKFVEASELYLDAGEFEPIRGLPELKADYDAQKSIDFSLVESFLARTWAFNFSTAAGRRGTVTLPAPRQMSKMMIDTRMASSPSATDVVLYKEMTFDGRIASSTGIFRRAQGAAYKLVLQGQGNVCDNASDYKYWRLDVNGSSASYELMGTMR